MIAGKPSRVGWAEQMKSLVGDYFPEARTFRVVMDNLNTHPLRSLYEAFLPEEARRLG